MPAAVKLALSVDALSSASVQQTQPELPPKCALRSALWALRTRFAVEGEHQTGVGCEGSADTDLYSLMRNCAFFNGGHCRCAVTPIKTSVSVVYQSRQQL
jgi:hypothetical protein